MAKLGLQYTPETKSDGTVPDTRSLYEIAFLKRGFRDDKTIGRHVSPLSLETILESPYWSHKGSLETQICHDNFENSLAELSLHGPNVFNEHYPILKSSYRSVFSQNPKLPGWL